MNKEEKILHIVHSANLMEENQMSNLDNDEQTEETLTFENLQTKIEIGGKEVQSEEITPKKALKHIRTIIDEYVDYQTVPNRRQSDIIFRTYITKQINSTNDKMKQVHSLLIEKQQMSSWAIAERLIDEYAAFSREVDKGDYGFTTFFDNPKLLEMDISQLYLIDFGLVESLKIMKQRTSAFMKVINMDYFEDIDLWMETLDRLIGRVAKLFDDRAKLVGSYERISY